MCPLTYLPSLLTEILLPRLNWLLSGKFLIFGFIFGVEIWRGCSSPYKAFRMLLLIFIGFGINERCFVEHKEVCCLMFP